jgi:hypothetical protein
VAAEIGLPLSSRFEIARVGLLSPHSHILIRRCPCPRPAPNWPEFLFGAGALSIELHRPPPARRNDWTMSRRFPQPWSTEDNGACFIMRDANGATGTAQTI